MTESQTLYLNILAGAYPEGRYALSKPIVTIGFGAGHDIDVRPTDYDGPTKTFGLLSRVGRGYRLQAQMPGVQIVKSAFDDASDTLVASDLLVLPNGLAQVESIEPEGHTTETSEEHLGRNLLAFFNQLVGHQEPADLIDGFLGGLIALTKAESGFILIRRPNKTDMVYGLNLKQPDVNELITRRSDTIVEHVYRKKEAILVHSATDDTIFSAADSVLNLKLSSVMCAPLMKEGRAFGVVYLGHNQFAHHFDDAGLRILKIYAGIGSLLLSDALDIARLKEERQELQDHIQTHGIGQLVGLSSPMQNIVQTIKKVSATDVTVLIRGETGTGKELIAKEIHRHSHRSAKPLVVLNCGAIPENLLESELFGHVKGAFTGAEQNRAGQILSAHEGTLFLDEIGEMPLPLQVKLLRVLQERMVTPVGGDKPKQVDIRVLAATHRDLPQMVKDGLFREDLYYRLNVIQIVSPPLRERHGDIRLLSDKMLKQFSDELGVSVKTLSADTLNQMENYTWPGNVRELQNRLKRAMVMTDGDVISIEDLEIDPETCVETERLQDAVEHFRRRYVMAALARNGGNRTHTAKELGVDPRTVFRYLEQGPEK